MDVSGYVRIVDRKEGHDPGVSGFNVYRRRSSRW